jgi:hypothetical protein
LTCSSDGETLPNLHYPARPALSFKIIEVNNLGFVKCPCLKRCRQEWCYPATRINASAPEFAAYIYNILFIYIYI